LVLRFFLGQCGNDGPSGAYQTSDEARLQHPYPPTLLGEISPRLALLATMILQIRDQYLRWAWFYFGF
jgi:hypothetical protein